MASIKVFAACRMRAFASLVARHFGVQVRLRGKDILVQYTKPPVIFLPALEYGKDQDLLPIYGFALHEAAHLKFTSKKVSGNSPNYLQKMLHNALEDIFIERKLERDFPGARELLLRAYTDGIKMVLGDEPIVETTSWLAPEAYARISEVMSRLGMQAENESLRHEVAKRLEIERVARLWIIESRQYPLPLYDWPSHPWHEVFQQETVPFARSTAETYAQAEHIIARLGIKPVLPGDARPIEVIADAKAKRAAVRAIKEAIRELMRSRKAEIDRQMSHTLERQDLDEAKERVKKAEQALKEAEQAAAYESAVPQKRVEAAEREVAEALDARSDAQRRFDEHLDEVRREVVERIDPEIEARRAELREKSKVATEAAIEAKKAASDIAKGDAKVDEPIMPGFLKKLAEAIFQAFRSETSADELRRLVENADATCADSAARDPSLSDAEKYIVYDRSCDIVVPVLPTAAAQAEYEKVRQKHAAVISAATDRLRRLYAPKHAHLKVNADCGRLDPRKAYRIGMAMRGVAMDIEKSWRRVEERQDRNVAVSLLLDCSGSMRTVGPCGHSRINLAFQSAAILSEVLSALSIPHEIIGHTTDEDGTQQLLSECDHCEAYSRLAAFKGYVFKPFAEKTPPVSIFSNIEMADNVDGEAVLWAIERLAARREKTKIAIVISDGTPAAEFSTQPELERHLYMTCKQVEARQNEGVFLFAIGVGEERTRRFYKNANVIPSASELPVTVLAVVEQIMGQTSKGTA